MWRKKIPTGMEQVAGKPSWRSRVANVYLTKHTVALVYMHVCVSIQLVSHMPNLHPADNRWMEIESWYDADRIILHRETSPTATIDNILHMNCLWSKSRSPRWKMSSENVAQTWLALSPVELWHRLDWLYHQWSCGTELAACITSAAVAQTWLILPPMGCSHPES